MYKYSFLIPPLLSIVAEIIPSSPVICTSNDNRNTLYLGKSAPPFKLWKASSLPYDNLGILAFSATTTCIPPWHRTCRRCLLMRLAGGKFFGNKECVPTLSLSQIIPPIHRLLFPLPTVCPSAQKVKISSRVGRQNLL